MGEQIILHEVGKDALYKIWHASKEHLFMYIYSDGGSIVTAEKIFPMKHGTLVFIAAGTYHYTMPDDPATYDRSKLLISPEKLDKLGTLLQENEILGAVLGKAVVYAEVGEQDRDNVERMFQELGFCRNKGEETLVMMACCMRLLVFLNQYITESAASVTGFMEKAISYINENIASELKIDEICGAVNMSKYYFCRKFKEHIGITVMEYILKTRLALAKNDLKKTKASVSEISEKYGFSSVSYFCRVFKADCMDTPLAYRRKYADKLG